MSACIVFGKSFSVVKHEEKEVAFVTAGPIKRKRPKRR